MSADLIKRLRDHQNGGRRGECEEAAAEIERLTAERDKWRAILCMVAQELNCRPWPVAEGNAHVFLAAEKLTAERDALRADAERYRWLKQRPDWLGWDHDFDPDEVEREIDAARQVKPQPPEQR